MTRSHSGAVEDYLKAIFALQEGEAAVSTTALADRLGRSAASVTNMVKSLAEQGLRAVIVDRLSYSGLRRQTWPPSLPR